MDCLMVWLGSMNGNSGLDHFLSRQTERMWRRWLKRSHVVRRWSTDWGKFCSDPPFTLPLRRQSEVRPWIVPLDVPSRTTRFPTIQQAHSRFDIGSNFGGWTIGRTKNRNLNALLKDKKLTNLYPLIRPPRCSWHLVEGESLSRDSLDPLLRYPSTALPTLSR